MTNLASTLQSTATTTVSHSFKFGITTADLYCRDGLVKLDQEFLDFLQKGNSELQLQLLHARAHPNDLKPKDESALLIEIAPWMEDFVAKLFDIEAETRALAAKHHELAPLYFCKRQFVQRRAKSKVKPPELAEIDGLAIEQKLVDVFGVPFSELVFATKVAEWMENEADNEENLKLALHYAAWALRTPEGQAHSQDGILFKAPAKLDFSHLLSMKTDDSAGSKCISWRICVIVKDLP